MDNPENNEQAFNNLTEAAQRLTVSFNQLADNMQEAAFVIAVEQQRSTYNFYQEWLNL